MLPLQRRVELKQTKPSFVPPPPSIPKIQQEVVPKNHLGKTRAKLTEKPQYLKVKSLGGCQYDQRYNNPAKKIYRPR